MLVHKEFGPSFTWMGNLAALKAKLREIGCGGDEDTVARGVISAEVIVHLITADMHIDYDAALLVVQSLKAHQYGDLAPRTKLFIKDAQQLYIASNSYSVCVFWLVSFIYNPLQEGYGSGCAAAPKRQRRVFLDISIILPQTSLRSHNGLSLISFPLNPTD